MAVSWRNLAEMDASFSQSRRRALARRARGLRHRSRASQATRALVVAGAAFAVAGGIVAEAETPARKRANEQAAAVARKCPVPERLRPAFVAASRETGVPLALLVAMAYEESRMDPKARSHAGAQGVLQLMPATARELEADVRVPRENILAGARYLDRMLARFDGNVDLALAAYNAGPAAVARAGRAPSLETLSYVLNVRARAKTLTACA